MSSRARRTVLVGAVLVVGVLIGLGVYVRVGWDRMEAACTADRPGSSWDTSSVSMGWSWDPVGFRCTDGEGRVRASLWF